MRFFFPFRDIVLHIYLLLDWALYLSIFINVYLMFILMHNFLPFKAKIKELSFISVAPQTYCLTPPPPPSTFTMCYKRPLNS